MSHKNFVVRLKAHCFDPGQSIGHPPASKTLEEIKADIARVNAQRGCEIMALLPVEERK